MMNFHFQALIKNRNLICPNNLIFEMLNIVTIRHNFISLASLLERR